MQNELDLKLCLTLFNKVVSEGDKNDDKFHWHGFNAWHDFDGYTCYLQFNRVTVTLLFHGKYAVDFQEDADWQQFIKKLGQISADL